MKKLYLIGGTMGVGKTTTGKKLSELLPDSVFLDGDWCWDMHPFRVTEETRKMVMGNIRHLLGSFLACSTIRNVVFCWVMHEQAIIDDILSGLPGEYEVVTVSLVCSTDRLRARLEKDVLEGKRTGDVIERSLARIEMYDRLDTVKLDVSEISPAEAAALLAGM